MEGGGGGENLIFLAWWGGWRRDGGSCAGAGVVWVLVSVFRGCKVADCKVATL